MKLLRREISAKDGDGFVVLCPVDAEDMWHAYNLLSAGDLLTGTTIRKVVKEAVNAVSSQRKRLTLTIQVLNVDFDPKECSIRISGRNMTESPHVKLAAFHTIELEPSRKFTLKKQSWDTIYLERLEMACNPNKTAQLAAVVMQAGLAHLCLITNQMTLLKAKVEKTIPKKRAIPKVQTEAKKKFFAMIVQAITREINFDVVKCIVLASPGHLKDEFHQYILEESEKDPLLAPVRKNPGMFVRAHASSGHKHALDEILGNPILKARILDSQAAKEVEVLNRFFKMLNDNSDQAFYSYNHVKSALDKQAIESLLITDSLFRASDIKTRKKYVALVEASREAGAEVFIFSSLHTSGEQLAQLSGIAAILRFPLPELDDLEMDEEENRKLDQNSSMPDFEDENLDRSEQVFLNDEIDEMNHHEDAPPQEHVSNHFAQDEADAKELIKDML